jgi:nicotinamidase-related amidase
VLSPAHEPQRLALSDDSPAKVIVANLIVMGMRANTCIESTVRFAAELGYEVTLVKDAIGSFGVAEMEASLRFNMGGVRRNASGRPDT